MYTCIIKTSDWISKTYTQQSIKQVNRNSSMDMVAGHDTEQPTSKMKEGIRLLTIPLSTCTPEAASGTDAPPLSSSYFIILRQDPSLDQKLIPFQYLT